MKYLPKKSETENASLFSLQDSEGQGSEDRYKHLRNPKRTKENQKIVDRDHLNITIVVHVCSL